MPASDRRGLCLAGFNSADLACPIPQLDVMAVHQGASFFDRFLIGIAIDDLFHSDDVVVLVDWIDSVNRAWLPPSTGC